MTVAMTPDQLQTLIRAIQAGGGGDAAGAAGPMKAAAMVGPMGPCTLGKDKLKRPKRWTDWHRDAENKMRFSGITDSVQKLNFVRSCAGVELTELWQKEIRVVYLATGEGAAAEAAHTYEQVVENTGMTLLKLVSRDRAIINLLRMEQGSRGFKDFLADMEDQMNLCHSWEELMSKDMKRISLLGGLKDRTLAKKALAEEYGLNRSSRWWSTGRVPRPTPR